MKIQAVIITFFFVLLIASHSVAITVPNTVDLENWKNQAEGYTDDGLFQHPIGTPDFQAMHLSITNGTEVPFASAAVFLNPGEQAAESLSVPLITANGFPDAISVDQNTPVSIAVQINPGDMVGQSADWWLVGVSPSGTQSCVVGYGWIPGFAPTWQGPLLDIGSPMEILNTNFEPGEHTFYFGVDLMPNGILDISTLYYSFVTVHVTASRDGLDLTRRLSVPLVENAIFPGIVSDGTCLYVSYGKDNDLYVQAYDTGFNPVSDPVKITFRQDVTDHKHLFFQNHHYLLYSTIGDNDLYLMKLNTALTQVGPTITVTKDSTTTRTNDMLLGTDGTHILTGEFRPSNLNSNETTGHLIKIFDTNLNLIPPEITANAHFHNNTAAIMKIGEQIWIVAPTGSVPQGQVKTQMDLGLIRFDDSWQAVDASSIKLVDSSTLAHMADGDGIWMSTGLAFDTWSNRMIVGHTFRNAASGSDCGRLYLRIFDAATFQETWSEVMVDSIHANRAHFLLQGDFLYVVYDDSTPGFPNIFGIQYAVTRHQSE